MRTPGIDTTRRRLLLAGLSLAGLPAVWAEPSPRSGAGLLVSGVYSGRGDDRQDRLVWRDPATGRGGRVVLPSRGHGVSPHPARPGRVVMVSRRPRDRLWEIDLVEGRLTREVTAEAGRHFYGHGVFSRDGSRFYTTENRYSDGAGRISVRDGADFRRLDEFPSGGIGPHDIHRLADDRTLVVANGGIRTHPERSRVKLNRDRMDSNLAYLDARTGALLERHRPPHPKLSIRHLAVTARDEVAAVQQFEGDRADLPPLVLLHRRGEEPRSPAVAADVLRRMNYYTASVAVDSASETALVTCPNGHLVTLWDLRGDRLAARFDLRRPFGAAFDPAEGAWQVTAETGTVHRIDPETGRTATVARIDAAWDNHLTWMPSPFPDG